MKKNILLIGVGGTGSNAVETFFKKYQELGNQTDNKVSALVFDTDAGDLKKITCAKTVCMADSASVGTICDRIGKQYLREWFPCDAKDVRAQEMVRGASQWRKKSYLAFLNLMNKPAERANFISALEEMVQDPSASCEVYVIASVAGGTGSGSFIPIALYAKRYLRKCLGKDPIVNAMIALPDIYADKQTPENTVKVFSNAYAILRELNAINLVARNYNAGLASKKKAPVCFKIGHEDEPNVGVLFDASDRRYWTPEAAPFSQVFLLDKIPNVNSIAAHDMVLANSLYTILCTDIGAAFDSEFSNHELVRSQNNGSNSIYAGISTSQVRFPKETVLDYLAHQKALSSCDNEWLTLHRTVESVIRDKEREAKDARRRLEMKDDFYAKLVLDAVEDKIDNNCEEIISIMERCVTVYDEDGKPTGETAGELFFDVIEELVKSRCPSDKSFLDAIKQAIKETIDSGKPTPEVFVDTARDEVYAQLLKYFKECFNAVKALPLSIADSVLTLDKRKVGTTGDRYTIADNLLTKNRNALHPVAALICLCQLRVRLGEEINANFREWEELKKRNVTTVPERFLKNGNKLKVSRSNYLSMGDSRFSELCTDDTAAETYMKKGRTKVVSDLRALEQDAEMFLQHISNEALAQLKNKVYKKIAENVDILIAKYRSFFARFEKEKDNLVEATADVRRRDAGAIDSVINVYSNEADKAAIAKIIDENNGPQTDSELRATDSLVGKGVLAYVMESAIAEASSDEDFNENNSAAYAGLFASMVDAYRESIAKSELFRNIASFNAIEAIVESCGEKAESKKVDDALRSVFSVAQERAIPSLRLISEASNQDLVTPSKIMVFMLSVNTARYIKKNADKFGIRIPVDQNSEGAVLKACAEQFIHSYSGNSSARVSIVSSIPDQILYCTGEIMDITPLCIAKFNELENAEDDKENALNNYFKHYSDALRRYRKYDTDMWNPHIGNDLYKRGFLPYMNPEMERACDEKMVKALLYAFSKDLIRYTDTVGATGYGKFYFFCGQTKILNNAGHPINLKNMAQLLNWLRNEDEKIEAWSAAFDQDIKEQQEALPSIITDNEIGQLESALTNSRFMKMLTRKLFTTDKEGTAVSAMEFAYLIKTSEEIDRDCDDAERILCVLYTVFKEMIGTRVSADKTPERFRQIYCQQLINFYQAFARIKFVTKAGKNCESYYAELVEWMNQAELFLDIDENDGTAAINKRFDFHKKEYKIKPMLEQIAKEAKEPKKDDAEEDPSDVPEAAPVDAPTEN